jgi:hypothetical protein
MHIDKYFIGYIDAAGPSYLPLAVQRSSILLKSYRLLLSLSGVYFALWEIFGLGPLFFCGLLGPKLIGRHGEAWMNPPDMFGSYSNVIDRGLAGWWGGWWHQSFRSTFEAPTNYLLAVLRVDSKSNVGRTIAVFIAFLISGCLHASGSYTQLGDTDPMMGPMRFFLLQACAVLTESLLSQQLSRIVALRDSPKLLKQAFNLVWVHIWLYFTAPLLVDDFARGGIW